MAEPDVKRVKLDQSDKKPSPDLQFPKADTSDDMNFSKLPGSEEPSLINTENFTSEIFKIMISNVPKYCTVNDVRKFLGRNELEPVKVKRPFKRNIAYVTFRDEGMRARAIETLNKLTWKKGKLSAVEAAPDESPFVRAGGGNTMETLPVREKTAPLYKLPYPEQLELKVREITTVFKGYMAALKTAWSGSLPAEGYNFSISEVRPSAVLTGYRNKCEFTVGANADRTDPCCVGYVRGQFARGNVSVEDAGECVETCSEAMLAEARTYRSLVQGSKFPPYDTVGNTGVWKALEVRTNSAGHVMVTVMVDKRQLTETGLAELKEAILAHYTGRSSLSLFLKLVGGKEVITHLAGPLTMTEQLCGLEFQITSGSFFQVNTAAAATLYSTIRELTGLDGDTAPPDTYLLDVCCGTGTIGLILSRAVTHVYGVEIVESAVRDARQNAERNGVRNVTFLAGNAKHTTQKAVRMIPERGRIIAIVDPPRNGLHPEVISCIRKTEAITELVYVSCDITQITDNIVALCGPTSRRYLGDPFHFVRAISVDMFPHTKKFEVVMHFRRSPPATPNNDD